MAVVDVVGDVRSMAWCRLLSGSMLAILLALKHETLDYENTSPQLFRWGPHCSSLWRGRWGRCCRVARCGRLSGGRLAIPTLYSV